MNRDAISAPVADTDTVVLLHGLLRRARSMSALRRAVTREGYRAVAIDYPSRSAPIRELVDKVLAPRIAELPLGNGRLHFVTHSMGGILVRDFLARYPQPQLGRVVMLAPPNQGSELVDRLGRLALFGWINGPAGRELATGANGLPMQLGPVHFPLGVITGRRSYNPLYSALIDGPNDGKVSVRSAQVEGMTDFRVVDRAHTFLMSAPEVVSDVLHFLQTGRFAQSDLQAVTA